MTPLAHYLTRQLLARPQDRVGDWAGHMGFFPEMVRAAMAKAFPEMVRAAKAPEPLDSLGRNPHTLITLIQGSRL
jgi:hypothetical protein